MPDHMKAATQKRVQESCHIGKIVNIIFVSFVMMLSSDVFRK